MPIFHFDIADGVRLEDPVGLDCKNEHDAKKAADLMARQIAIDLEGDHEPRAVVGGRPSRFRNLQDTGQGLMPEHLVGDSWVPSRLELEIPAFARCAGRAWMM